MTFPTGNSVIKMEYSEEEISAVFGASEEEILAVLAESEQERKRLRKLGKVMETAAAYRPNELQHF